MSLQVLYSKTAKGMAELAHPPLALPHNTAMLLAQVDGQSGYSQLQGKCVGLSTEEFKAALNDLLDLGLIRVLVNEDMGAAQPLCQQDIAVAELNPEEGVRAWAEAVCCARSLTAVGFYATGGQRTRQHSVLLVENAQAHNTQSISQLAMLLNEAGFETRHAASGQEAMALLQAQTPELIILDVNLPDTTGFQLLTTLLQNPAYKAFRDIPVIMVTAQAGDEDMLNGIRGGAEGYIFKPFQHESLMACVRQVLEVS